MSVTFRLGVEETSGCLSLPSCHALAERTLNQLNTGAYNSPASIRRADSSFGKTARRRTKRAENKGYIFYVLHRERHEGEIFDINTSLTVRQGRPMSEAYFEAQSFTPLPDYPCHAHEHRTYGVWSGEGTLVAYIVLLICGDLVLVSQILGHGKFLQDDIMYLLATRALSRFEGKNIFYNMHNSGTDGLRYYKERLGFLPEDVEWVL